MFKKILLSCSFLFSTTQVFALSANWNMISCRSVGFGSNTQIGREIHHRSTEISKSLKLNVLVDRISLSRTSVTDSALKLIAKSQELQSIGTVEVLSTENVPFFYYSNFNSHGKFTEAVSGLPLSILMYGIDGDGTKISLYEFGKNVGNLTCSSSNF